MARRVVATRPGRTIDFKQWTAIPGGSQSVSGNTTFAGPGLLAFGIPATILRVRGHFRVSMQITGLTAGDEVTLVFGLGIFSTDATAVGASALPDPSAEAEFPWLWYQSVMLQSINADSAEPGSQTLVEVDTKAMRKIKPGQSLAMVGQYVDTVGAPGVRINMGQIRVLFGT